MDKYKIQYNRRDGFIAIKNNCFQCLRIVLLVKFLSQLGSCASTAVILSYQRQWRNGQPLKLMERGPLRGQYLQTCSGFTFPHIGICFHVFFELLTNDLVYLSITRQSYLSSSYILGKE